MEVQAALAAAMWLELLDLCQVAVDLPRVIRVELPTASDATSLVIGDSRPRWSGAEQTEMPLHTTKKEGTGIGF
jgi:hypothetical protein